MLDMFVFWLSYGFWMVFSWGGMLFCLITLADVILKWITEGDYNLHSFLDKVFYENIFTNNPLVIAIMFVLMVGQILHTILLGIDAVKGLSSGHILNYHEFAVKIANFVSEYLTTPIMYLVVLTFLVVSAKKGYPLIKKILTLVDNINNQK